MTKRPYALMNMPVPIKDRTEALPDSDAKESSPKPPPHPTKKK